MCYLTCYVFNILCYDLLANKFVKDKEKEKVRQKCIRFFTESQKVFLKFSKADNLYKGGDDSMEIGV